MLQPFITFQGKAAQAADFYEKVFGGTDKEIMRWGDMPPNPEMPVAEEMKDKVLYGKMTIGGTTMMFSDTDPNFHAPEVFAPSCFVSLAVNFENAEALKAAYGKLSEDGKVLMELGETFFAKQYAWVADKFGVTWQLTFRTE
jgi:PhnB protein